MAQSSALTVHPFLASVYEALPPPKPSTRLAPSPRLVPGSSPGKRPAPETALGETRIAKRSSNLKAVHCKAVFVGFRHQVAVATTQFAFAFRVGAGGSGCGAAEFDDGRFASNSPSRSAPGCLTSVEVELGRGWPRFGLYRQLAPPPPWSRARAVEHPSPQSEPPRPVAPPSRRARFAAPQAR